MTEILIPATQDEVHLAAAIEPRFLDLCGAYKRIKGVDLPIPKAMQSAIVLWRQCMVRFKGGDFRTSHSERKAVKEVAQWTLDENCDLRNQPRKKLPWTA